MRVTALKRVDLPTLGRPTIPALNIEVEVKDEGEMECDRGLSKKSGRRDSNPRPLEPHSSALPSCATARRPHYSPHRLRLPNNFSGATERNAQRWTNHRNGRNQERLLCPGVTPIERLTKPFRGIRPARVVRRNSAYRLHGRGAALGEFAVGGKLLRSLAHQADVRFRRPTLSKSCTSGSTTG